MDVNGAKVLYISYDGLTDPLGQSQILPYLTGLSEKGYRFTILSFEKKERLAKEGALILKLTKAANIQWVPLLFTANPPVLSKIYDRYQMLQKAISLHRKERFQLVHCRSYVSAEVGLQLKKRFGVKMLFDMRGFWADEKVDNGQWNLEQPFYKWIYNHYKRKEKEFLLQADGIVSLTEAAKEYLLTQPDYKGLSIEVIPCCADLDHFNYKNVNQREVVTLKSSLNIASDAKVISYVGSFGGWYMTKEMFSFVKLLQSQNPLYVFLFLTKDDPEKVKKEAVEQGIDLRKLIVTYANRQQLPAFIALSNGSLFFIRNTFSKIASSPTKHAELMGMGVPVICNAIGDTGKIVTQTNTGQLINSFEPSAMQQAVNQLPLIEGIQKEHIRSCAVRLFDLQTGVKKYFSLYNQIISGTKTSAPMAEHA